MQPSSTVTTRKKMAIIAALYFAQGSPYALITRVLPVFFRELGMPLDKIGILGLIQLPWTVKPFWAPLVDKYGERWQWIRAMQTIMAVFVVCIAYGHATIPPLGLWALVLLTCIASATQDIAIDAYTIEMCDEKELGQANGIRVAAFRVAIIAVGGGLISLAQWLPWGSVFLVFSGTLLILSAVTSLIGKRYQFLSGEKKQTLLGAYWVPVKRLFQKNKFIIAVLFILLFKVGDAMMTFMVPAFWIDHGFSKVEYGSVSATFGTVLTIIGALLGGWITSRIGIFRALLILGALQAISNLGYAYADLNTSRYSVYGASMFESFSSGLGTAPFLAYLMNLCEKEYAAMQYACMSAIFGFSRSISEYVGGLAAQNFGYFNFFVISFFAALVAFPLLLVLKNTFDKSSGTVSPTVD
jgi:MFS transporter, PAT family, beta-lactamase induction signal transducer AmpG